VLIVAVGLWANCGVLVAGDQKVSKAKPMPIPVEVPTPIDIHFVVSQHYIFNSWSLGDIVDWAFPARFTISIMPGSPWRELQQRVADQLGGVPIGRIDISQEGRGLSHISSRNGVDVNVMDSGIEDYGTLRVSFDRFLELRFDCDSSKYPENGLEARALVNQIRKSVLETMKKVAVQLLSKLTFSQFDFGDYLGQQGECLNVLLEADQSITQQALDTLEQGLKVNNGTTIDGFQYSRLYWGSSTVYSSSRGRSGNFHPI